MNRLEINISHLTKAFSRPVLTDINLTITNESYISIIGASGCGKSTLMNILGLVESFDSGSFTFNGTRIQRGRDYAKLRRDNIGFVFQSYNLISALTCKENIMLPSLYKKINIQSKFEEVVERLEIVHLLNQRVNTLSGGEKQRVAFARSLMLDPCLLIADEPTGNLDPQNRNTILGMLDAENRNGRGIILITHDMNLADMSKISYQLRGGELHEIKKAVSY